jgi:hypothetical protein
MGMILLLLMISMRRCTPGAHMENLKLKEMEKEFQV